MPKRVCPNGHIVKDKSASFCPQCGAPLSEIAPVQRRTARRYIALGIGAFVLVMAIAIIVSAIALNRAPASPQQALAPTALPSETAPLPTDTAAPSPTATERPSPTATPRPSDTPKPTATPSPRPTQTPTLEPTPRLGSREQPCVLGEACAALYVEPFDGGALLGLTAEVLKTGAEAQKTLLQWNMFNQAPRQGLEYILLDLTIGYVEGDVQVVEINRFSFATVTNDGKVYDIPFVVAGNPRPCEVNLMQGAEENCILPALRPIGQPVYLVYNLRREESTWIQIP